MMGDTILIYPNPFKMDDLGVPIVYGMPFAWSSNIWLAGRYLPYLRERLVMGTFIELKWRVMIPSGKLTSLLKMAIYS